MTTNENTSEFQNNSFFEAFQDVIDKIEEDYLSHSKMCNLKNQDEGKRKNSGTKCSIEKKREIDLDCPSVASQINDHGTFQKKNSKRTYSTSSRNFLDIHHSLDVFPIPVNEKSPLESEVQSAMQMDISSHNEVSQEANITDELSASPEVLVQYNLKKSCSSDRKHAHLKRSCKTLSIPDKTESHSEERNVLNNSEMPCGEVRGFKSYIKHTLMLNAFSPVGSRNSVKRGSIVEDAIKKAQQIGETISECDIGPFYGLPSHVKTLLKQERGIEDLYSWQHECLNLPAVQKDLNLIYSLPTSGGKTLVAEILILRILLCKKKNAIFVLPYISIVQEKVRALSPFAVDLNFMVEEYAASRGTFPPRKRRKRQSVYMCTIEKANSLINSLIETGRMNEIGLVIVDELHMLSDGSRGAILESLLAKVKYVSPCIQIIGMSATLGNIEDLQEFLQAEVYRQDFRPIQLKEFIKVGNKLLEFDPACLDSYFSITRTLSYHYTTEMLRYDPDFLMGLVKEVIPQHSCLIFCPTKKHCENVAQLLSQMLPKTLKKYKWNEKKALYKALADEAKGAVCPIFSRTLPYGVAYHHSGLTSDERKLIEEGFISSTLCCLTCTSTLAAGVNLPAKRVIIRAPYVGTSFLTYSRYKQMAGRAGRAGLDTSGESILILKGDQEEQKGRELLNSSPEACLSSFFCDGGKNLKLLILSIVGLELAISMKDIQAFINGTLFAIQEKNKGKDPNTFLTSALMELQQNNMIILSSDSCGKNIKLKTTKLGRAVFKGGVDLDQALGLFSDLHVGLDGLALHSHLHLLYLVLPLDYLNIIPVAPDLYFQVYTALNAKDMHVAELIGVTEATVVLLVSGRANQVKNMVTTHRFYLSLILYELWKQAPLWEVAQKFHQQRGVIQNLLVSTASFASCVNHFCEEFEEFWAYRDMLPNFTKQLSYCVSIELIPLMELPAVKGGRARQFYNAGFKTLTDIAKADPNDLVRHIDHLPRRVASQIVSAAKMLLLEKAEALQEEAEEVMSEIGHLVITQSEVT